ncbi:Putative protein in type-1 retrotransposable element R1DM, partial [Araneus ventricosus]
MPNLHMWHPYKLETFQNLTEDDPDHGAEF